MKKEQDKILKDGSARDCYLFARDVKGADVEKLQDRIKELYYEDKYD